MSEKFCLKWNDFQSNVSKSFRIFRNEDYLHDVTLVGDDHIQVSAHKLVLSASSEYFKDLFKNNKHSFPMICLEGISSNDLTNILDYMYNGEIQIYQDHLDRFLIIAKRLKLEGLLSDNSSKEEEIKPSPKMKLQEVLKVEESYDNFQTEIIMPESQIELTNSDDTSELDQKLYEYMEKNSDGKYSCKLCGKVMKTKAHMKLHVETHIEGLSFSCNICGKEYRSRNSLGFHTYRHHK